MTLDSHYDYNHFKNLCKEIDSLMGRKANGATSLQARLIRPLAARELQEMHSQISEEFSTYKALYLRRSNYKVLAALAIAVVGSILIIVGVTSNAGPGLTIVGGGTSLGCGLMLAGIELSWARPHVIEQARRLTGFQDIVAFAGRSSDPTNTVSIWFSSFRARTLTGV